jgi:FdhD protein
MTDRGPIRPLQSTWDTSVVRVRGQEPTAGRDSVAVEEPLEIRLHGRSFAVIMRTPGADRELAAGFLLAERVIRTSDDLGTIEHCTQPEANAEGPDLRVDPGIDRQNMLNVTLAGRSSSEVERLLAERRAVLTSSACGLCGRSTIESLKTDVAPLPVEGSVSAAVLAGLPDRLRAQQPGFDLTGGLHAAALFTWDGVLITAAEDVGRHNAVDKVVGRRLLLDGLPARDTLLAVSGRTSFEIVQKAVLAGIPLVAAVSAPSSLAVALAQETGVTLLGFVRDRGFTIYAHEGRVRRA